MHESRGCSNRRGAAPSRGPRGAPSAEPADGEDDGHSIAGGMEASLGRRERRDSADVCRDSAACRDSATCRDSAVCRDSAAACRDSAMCRDSSECRDSAACRDSAVCRDSAAVCRDFAVCRDSALLRDSSECRDSSSECRDSVERGGMSQREHSMEHSEREQSLGRACSTHAFQRRLTSETMLGGCDYGSTIIPEMLTKGTYNKAPCTRDVQDHVTGAAPTTSEDLREGREDISPVCGATDAQRARPPHQDQLYYPVQLYEVGSHDRIRSVRCSVMLKPYSCPVSDMQLYAHSSSVTVVL